MTYVKLFEEYISESTAAKGYIEKKRDITDKLAALNQKRNDLGTKIKALSAKAEDPSSVTRAELGRQQLKLVELDRQRAIIQQIILDLNRKLEFIKK